MTLRKIKNIFSELFVTAKKGKQKQIIFVATNNIGNVCAAQWDSNQTNKNYVSLSWIKVCLNRRINEKTKSTINIFNYSCHLDMHKKGHNKSVLFMKKIFIFLRKGHKINNYSTITPYETQNYNLFIFPRKSHMPSRMMDSCW